ncbi:hypothetical protein V9K67_21310 [Paraflavisolibacter sp. H34]|uniref:hypothetical protein n=1 Tax=Huijunlia imazamoxiresistens TaxID=3127457 RepID=UPI003017F29D
MKLSYHTNPALALLHAPVGKRQMPIPPEALVDFLPVQRHIKESLDRYTDLFRSNVQVITNPFAEAIHLCYDKLQTEEVMCSLENLSGCLIYPGSYSFLYHLENQQKGVIFFFSCNRLAYYTSYDHGKAVICDMMHQSPSFKDQSQFQIWDEVVNFLSTTLAFIKFAEVQTRYLPAGKKVKDISCMYLNETDLKVQLLDCRWITTLVRTEGFKVRGHFRLQPKKRNGEWTKELIKIDEYMKTGYTMKAGKLRKAKERDIS